MKIKILACTLCALSCVIATAYTTDDVDRADRLASLDVITDHTDAPELYRLDDSMSRAEVAKMALKLRGVGIPATYTCKNYFADVKAKADSTNDWICMTVELAADRGIISRNANFRPQDSISRVEALAIIWRASEVDAESNMSGELFYDSKGKPASEWQQTLLEKAEAASIISPIREEQTDGKIWLRWRHEQKATRKEIFTIVETLYNLRQAARGTLTGNIMSGEVQVLVSPNPKSIFVISTDPTLVADIEGGKFDSAIAKIKPTPVQFSSSDGKLLLMQYKPNTWGQVYYSIVGTVDGRVYQAVSPYNPYDEAIADMLREFGLASEADFYALPYGYEWRKSREFVEKYYTDKFLAGEIFGK